MSEELDLSIDNYISDKFSICREERQYALYLSNVLRYYGKNPNKKGANDNSKPYNRIRDNEKIMKIFIACGFNEKELENIVIENVFYEATFMRDIFEWNRQKYFKSNKKLTEDNKRNSFSLRLLEYCWTQYLKQDRLNIDVSVMKENNYGARNEIPFLTEEVKGKLTEERFISLLKVLKGPAKEQILRDIKYKAIVRAMMNAKPDLAVIYEDMGKRKLLFLECKYLSKEDDYSYYIDINPEIDKNQKKGKIQQTEVQAYIADFLCNYSPEPDHGSPYLKDVKVSEKMLEDQDGNPLKSIKVIFNQTDKELSKIQSLDNDNNDIKNHTIYIKDLIELEKDIFNR